MKNLLFTTAIIGFIGVNMMAYEYITTATCVGLEGREHQACTRFKNDGRDINFRENAKHYIKYGAKPVQEQEEMDDAIGTIIKYAKTGKTIVKELL